MREYYLKNCYEIDAKELKSDFNRAKISNLSRNFYRSIIDEIWQTESQFKLPLNLDFISEKIMVTHDEAKICIEELTKKGLDCGVILLEERFDLINDSTYLAAPELERQIKEYREWERHQNREAERKNKNNVKNLTERIRLAKENQDPLFSYLKVEERLLKYYNGFLPTNKFEEHGLIFNVRSFFLTLLREEFPNINVDSQLINIYNWLKENKTKRKTVAQMNRFIRNWMERADNFNNPISKKRNAEEAKEMDVEFDKFMKEDLF